MSNSLVVRVGADIRDFQREMKKLTRDTDLVGKSLVGIGTGLSKKVTAPLVGMATASIAAATTFEKGMSKVEATVTGAGNNMEKLTGIARTWGRESIFNANEVASAMSQKGLAGLETVDIYNSMADTIALATSANMGLAEATGYLTNVMGIFGKSGEDATLIADMMTSANKTVDASISDIAKTFANAGSAINQHNIELKDAMIITTLMADASLTGAKAGTAFRAMIDDLALACATGNEYMRALNVSFFDVDGYARPAMDVIQDLRGALGDLSPAQQTAKLEMMEMSVTGQKSLIPMLSATEYRIDYLTDRYGDVSGAAAHYAAIMKDNVIMQTQIFWGNIRDIGIEIGNVFLPAINRTVGRVTEIARAFSDRLTPEMAESIVKWGGIAAAIGPALVIGGKTIIMLGQMKAALTILAGAKGATVLAGGKLHGVLGLGTKAAKGASGSLGVKGLAGAAVKVSGALAGIKFAPVIAGVAGVAVVAKGVHEEFTQNAIPAINWFESDMERLADGTFQINQRISEHTREITQSYLDLNNDIRTEITAMKNTQLELTDEMVDGVTSRIKEMSDIHLSEIKRQKHEGLEILESRLREEGVLDEYAIQQRLYSRASAWQEQIDTEEASLYRKLDIVKNAQETEGGLTSAHHSLLSRLLDGHLESTMNLLVEDTGERDLIMANFHNQTETQQKQHFARLLEMAHAYAEEQRGALTIRTQNEMSDLTNHFNSGETITDEHLQQILAYHLDNWTKTEEEAIKFYTFMYKQLRDHQEQGLGMTDEHFNQIQQTIVRSYNEQQREINEALSAQLDSYERHFPEMSRIIDRETGLMRSNWDRLRENFRDPITGRVNIIQGIQNTLGIGNNANGTHNWEGGLSWVNERGPELIDLPEGSRVIPAPLSRLMSQERGRELARMESRNQSIQHIHHHDRGTNQQGVNITINIPEMVIREDADIDRIANEMSKKIRQEQRARGYAW